MKSIFTKLSTLLLCGAVALVGCTDYSEDIQAVDKNVNDLKTEFEGYKTSTAATIAELQSAIDALEAAQEKMAAEYAKKSELETAVTTLQNLVNEKAEQLQAALTEAAGKIAALEAGKADKTEVAALQEQVTKAIEDANAAIKALEAAKADKAELELVKADVASLIEGYTQMIEALQNITNTLTTVQSDLDIVEEDVEALKTAAAEAVYAITNLQASVEALSARVESLEKDLASAKQEIAQHTEALTNLAYGLEAETVAREEADLALQQAVMLLNEGLTNITFAYNAHIEEMEAYKENLAKEMDDLRAQDSALANSILSYYNESLAAVESAMTVLREEQAAAIAALKAEIVAAWEKEKAAIHTMIYDIQTTLQNWCQENSDAIEALQAQDGALAKIIIDNYETLVALIAEGDSELKTYTDEQIVLLYNTVMDWLKTLNIVIEENDAALLEKITKNYTELSETIAKNFDILAEQIKTLRNDLENAINGVSADVEKLLARVQSLTYVPDFNDHKAAINYAILVNHQAKSKSYVVRETIIRYRVNAKAGQSAAEAAVELAAAWKANPSILEFDLQSVADAATRSNEAYLQISKVKAQDDDLFVYVVAKNFGDNFFAKKAHYSAALVLSDGNNNISSEYTNLSPGNVEELTPVILDANDKDITGMNAVTENLPYDLDPREVVVLENHRLAFTLNNERTYLSVDDLLAAGYDLDFGRSVRSVQVNGEGRDAVNDYKYDPRVEPLRVAGPFRIEERPANSYTVEGNTYVTLNEPITKEQYLELRKNELNKLSVTFSYHINGQTLWTEGSVEITNRLVNVVFNIDVPWTFETAISTAKDGVVYASPLKVNYKYDLNASVEGGKSLTGYSLKTILKEAKRSDGGHYNVSISMGSITEDSFTASLTSGSEKYKFPLNDSNDKTNLVNSYYSTFRRDFEDITVAIKVVMNLGEQAPAQNFKDTKTFTPEFGYEKQLRGYWNPVDVAFASFVEDGYIKESSKDAFVAAFADKDVYAMPTVDGKTGNLGNTNPAFELGNNTFILYQYQVGNGFVDGKSYKIKQNVAPYFGIPYTFELTAEVDLGEYALDTDEVRVVNDVVNVLGEIEEIDGQKVYTVNLSDLAKYYYVVNTPGVKKLEDVNGNDKLTVDFKLSPMADAKEEGFNFNNIVGNTTCTLPVDWTKDAPYLLEQDKAVVHWGDYPYTEVVVNAVLSVNGFPVAEKAITLVTEDPLQVQLNDVNVSMDQFAGDDKLVAKIYQNFVLTSKVQSLPNLFDVKAETIAETLTKSKADITYKANITAELLKVYYKDANGVEKEWDLEKLTFGNMNWDTMMYDGTVSINPDDANIETPIYVKSKVVFTHNIHNASKESCETVGEVILTFNPAKK